MKLSVVFRYPLLICMICLLAPFSLLAQDTARGTTSERSPIAKAGLTRAVIVGISSYKNLPAARQLDYAHKDAELFHNYLQLTRKPAATKIFMNGEATSSRIMLAVDEMISASAAGDELIFYFAGHGDVAKDRTRDQDDAYLLCTEVSTDADYALSDAISLSRLQQLIADAAKKGVQVSLITDACRSGKVATTEEAAYSTAYIISQKWDKVMKLASCQENELSYESAKWGNGHGVFTYYLVRGLSKEADVSPQDNNVTLKELELYIKKEVSEATSEGQNPIKVGGDARKVFGSLIKEDLLDAAFVLPKMETLLASRSIEGGMFNSQELNSAFDRFKSFVRSGYIHDSAYNAYLDFVARDTAKKYAHLLKNELIVELVASSQRLLDKYMQGGNDMPPSGNFYRASKEMELAVKLYDRRNSIAQLWTSKQLFLQAFTYIRGQRREKYKEATELLTKALKGNKKAAYIHQAFGRMYNDIGDYKKSEKYLLEAIRLAPRWTYPRSDLGNTYRDMLKWTRSEEIFKETMKLDPTLARLYNNLGNIYLDQGRLAQSESLYLKADALAPNTAVYFSNLGVVHRTQGRKESALNMYHKALSIDSTFYHTYEHLANYYLEEKKIYDRGSAALKFIRKAIEIEPYYHEAYNLLGDYYFDFGRNRQDLDSGIAAYRKAISLNHRDLDSYFDLAYYLVHRIKDTVTADAVIAEMVKKNPGSGSWYHKGLYEENKKNLAEAETWYRKALKSNPYEFYVYTELSSLLEGKGRLKEAEEILLQSLPYYSNAPERLYNIANFYIRTGNTKEAVRFYEQCLAIDSSYSYAWSSLSYVLLQSDASAKQVRNAFDKARALNPALHKPEGFASMLKMKADSLFAAKADPSLTISFLREAVSLDPSKKDIYQLEIARVNYFLGKNSEAFAALELISKDASHFVTQGAISLKWKMALEERDFESAKKLIAQEMQSSSFPSHIGNALVAALSGDVAEAKRLIGAERKENPANLKKENLAKKFNTYLLKEIENLMQQ